MIQICKTCGAEFDYHDPCEDCLPCQKQRIDADVRIARICINTGWGIALLSVAAMVIIVIWRSLPQF